MTEPTPPTASPPSATTPARGSSSWRRLARAGAPRSTKAQALGAALALALGFAIATQIQQTQDSGLDSMRQDDLVRVLDDVSQRSSRLDQQVRELQSQRDALRTGANTARRPSTRPPSSWSRCASSPEPPPPGPGDPGDDRGPRPQGHRAGDAGRAGGAARRRRRGGRRYRRGRVVASSSFVVVRRRSRSTGQPLARPFTVIAIGDKATMLGPQHPRWHRRDASAARRDRRGIEQ